MKKIPIKKMINLLIIFFIGCFFWFISAPSGLTENGWHLLIIFILTIIAIILKPMPIGAIALTSISILSLTKVLTINTCLSSYSKPIVWMVVFAFFIARGFSLTGLGTRLAYFFVSIFGFNVLGLAYGFAITDLLLSPAVPSNTARGAGIIFPIIKSLIEDFESESIMQKNSKNIGAFLMKVAFQINLVTSTMFLTAIACNPLIVIFAKNSGIEISWSKWMISASVPGIICFICVPLIIYLFYFNKIKKVPDFRIMAKKRLLEIGPMKNNQIIMLITFLLILFLWIFGDILGISSCLAALIGIIILLLSDVLRWDDLLNEKSAWSTLIWFSILLMLAEQLQVNGVINWFGEIVANYTDSYGSITSYIFICIIYFYIHYFFASSTALVSSIYPVFLMVLINSGVNPFSAAISLGVFTSLSACLTNYGTGTAPVYFGANYIKMGQWWKIGAILSVFYLIIWCLIGNFWWNLLGY